MFSFPEQEIFDVSGFISEIWWIIYTKSWKIQEVNAFIRIRRWIQLISDTCEVYSEADNPRH